MNYKDCAKQLAKALNKSQEYQRFNKASKAVEGNSKYKQILKDFRMKQMEVQKAQMLGKKNQAQINKLEDMYKQMLKDQNLKEFFEAEVNFTKVMMEVQKIIGQGVGIDMGAWSKK